MWGEEAGHVVVVKGEAGGSQALGIGCEIEFAAEDAGLKLYGTIAAVSKAIENRPQICQEENVHGGVGGQLLLQSQVACLVAKISLLQTFERSMLEHFTVAVEDIRSGFKTFDGVDNQVEMVELRSERVEEVGRDAARRPVEHGGELGQADRSARKLAAGTAPQDDLLDGIARHFGVGKGRELNVKLNAGSGGRRRIRRLRAIRRSRSS